MVDRQDVIKKIEEYIKDESRDTIKYAELAQQLVSLGYYDEANIVMGISSDENRHSGLLMYILDRVKSGRPTPVHFSPISGKPLRLGPIAWIGATRRTKKKISRIRDRFVERAERSKE